MAESPLSLLQVLVGGGLLTLLGKLGHALLSRKRLAQRDENRLQEDLRDELRRDIAQLRKEQQELRKEVDELRDDVDAWRDRYYRLLAEYVDLNSRYKSLEAEFHKRAEP